MPILQSSKNIGNSVGYAYDISADDVEEIIVQLSANADAPITFLGKIGDYTREFAEPRMAAMTLSQGGMVAASTSVGGVPVKLQFAGATMVILPDDGDQATADMLAGTGDFAYDDGAGFDPFDDAGTDVSDGYAMPDPRARSQELANRYGDAEDFDDAEYYDAQPAGNGQGADSAGVVKVTEWLFTVIVLMLPVVNIVALIIWLVSKKTNPSKKNYLKVQLIMMVVGLLFSALIGVMAVQTGVVGALMGQQQSSSQVVQYDNTNLDRRGDSDSNMNENSNMNTNENANANENANSNMNSNSNENAGGPAANIPEEDATAVGELTQQNSGVIAVDNVVRAMTPENRSVAIVTLTMNNTTDREDSAAGLIDISGNQGQNSLEPNFTPFDGFNPDTFNMPIRPGESGTFQISYLLVDDQDLKIHATAKDGGAVILDATQVLR